MFACVLACLPAGSRAEAGHAGQLRQRGRRRAEGRAEAVDLGVGHDQVEHAYDATRPEHGPGDVPGGVLRLLAERAGRLEPGERDDREHHADHDAARARALEPELTGVDGPAAPRVDRDAQDRTRALASVA